MFNLTYKFFTILKPSQIWVIILALLNRTNIKDLIKIPSMFILFNSFFSESNDKSLSANDIQAKLVANKFNDSSNNFEVFF